MNEGTHKINEKNWKLILPSDAPLGGREDFAADYIIYYFVFWGTKDWASGGEV